MAFLLLPWSCDERRECPPQEHDVETPYGMLRVVIRGAPKGNKPAILTYHDVGLNREYPHSCGTGGGSTDVPGF